MLQTNRPASFFEPVVSFFQEYSWIYDFKATEIITDPVKASIPSTFVNFYRSLSLDDKQFHDMLNLVDHNESATRWPSEVQKFVGACRDLKRLSESIKGSLARNHNHSVPLPSCPEKFSLPKKWNPKKYLEVMQVGNFVGELVIQENCDVVVDIGSGLGYLSSHLANRFKIPVVGIESEASRVETARKNFRQTNSTEGSCSVPQNYVCLRISENISDEIEPHVKEYERICLTALHACGDLTPWSLRYFVSSEPLKCIAVVPCCYHKMDVTGPNFPMSHGLKSSLSHVGNLGFLKNTWLWRLASQRSGSKFLGDINKETKNLFYRAILEKYSLQDNLQLVKKKRNVQVTFTTFAEYLDKMIGLEGAFNLVKDKGHVIAGDELINAFNQLNKLHHEESEWSLVITGMLAMQGALQSIAEDLILLDRLAFLDEAPSVYKCGLIKVIADEVSPRGMVLFGMKK